MVATITTLSTQPNIDRSHWEASIAKLINQALPHSEVYTVTINEVEVGSGIIALHAARTGSKVYGLDINPDAVAITRKVFEMNALRGDIRVSDLFAALDPGTKVDYIFWNPPWQISRTVVRELQSEKTLDEGYKALSHYIRDGHTYLNDGGSILIGTSCYADLNSLHRIALQHGYASVVVAAQGQSHLADGTCEIYYILRLDG